MGQLKRLRKKTIILTIKVQNLRRLVSGDMKGKNTITINGRLYDAVTGFPVGHEAHSVSPAPHQKPSAKEHKPAAHPKPHKAFSDIAVRPVAAQRTVRSTAHTATQTPANTVHQQPQRTHTLYRSALQKPVLKEKVGPTAHHSHPAISRFGPKHNAFGPQLQPIAEPVEDGQPAPVPPPDAAPTMHPTALKALMRREPQASAQLQQSSRQLKEQLIRDRLAEVDTKKDASDEQGKTRLSLQPRLATVITSAFALLLLGGYLTYMNLPNLSMRVAAARAGIAARYPNYHPDGYSFSGPISYQPGEVTINFKSNTNDDRFNIKQKASNWDSRAVLDNYVSKQSSTYLTYVERGLTIYSFNNKAAWVSGGTFYLIDGGAPLSSEQVLRIATSI
jgi:hypothetical protein